LDSLAGRVTDLTELANKGPGLGGHRTDKFTLLRYLRSRNWSVDAAEKQLREAGKLQ